MLRISTLSMIIAAERKALLGAASDALGAYEAPVDYEAGYGGLGYLYCYIYVNFLYVENSNTLH